MAEDARPLEEVVADAYRRSTEMASLGPDHAAKMVEVEGRRVREPYFDAGDVTLWHGDARTAADWLPADSVDAVMTSPPYFGLRDYGVDGQLGLEDTPDAYVADLADTLTSLAGPLKEEGSLWLNIGDTYAANRTYQVNQTRNSGPEDRARVDAKPMRVPDGWQAKSLLMVPERVALAMIDRGWILRSKVVWQKPNAMPESVKDRVSTTWEYVFHFVRRQSYYFDLDAVREPHADSTVAAADRARPDYKAPGQTVQMKTRTMNDGGKNPGDLWQINTKPYPEAHFAVYPPELCERPIKATVPEGGVVLDPFFGAGMTAVMARRLGRRCWGVELNEDYCELAAGRFRQQVLGL